MGLDPEERSNLKLGRQGVTNIISESGLYLLVLKSRKAEAKAFQKWVTGEVLGGDYRYRGTGHPVGKDHSVIPLPWSHLKAPTGPRSDGLGVVTVGHFRWTEGASSVGGIHGLPSRG